jgi:hypothetical protein
VSFGQVFAELVKAGHDARQLPRYTLRQLTLYYVQAQAAQNRSRADLISDVNAAMWGDVQATNQTIKALRGT